MRELKVCSLQHTLLVQGEAYAYRDGSGERQSARRGSALILRCLSVRRRGLWGTGEVPVMRQWAETVDQPCLGISDH